MAWNIDVHNSAKGMLMGSCRSNEALMTLLRPSAEETESSRNRVSSKRSFCSFLDQHDTGGNDSAEESTQQSEKKKRLTAEQVKSLEISFEMENKLEPERKQKLASDLGLQPRQVAVWFQNRRARWRAKRLEHDFDTLKSEYDVLFVEREELRAEEKEQQLAGYQEGKPPKPSNALSETVLVRNLTLTESGVSDKTESPGSSEYTDTVDGDDLLSPPDFQLQYQEDAKWEVGSPPPSSSAGPLLPYYQPVDDDLNVYQPFALKLEEVSTQQEAAPYNNSGVLPTYEHDFSWLWGN
eukprot:c28488_g2_i2 orf=968-1852(+)